MFRIQKVYSAWARAKKIQLADEQASQAEFIDFRQPRPSRKRGSNSHQFFIG
jgi:hypothetical protein